MFLRERKQLLIGFYKLAVIFIALVIFTDSAQAYSYFPIDNLKTTSISGTQEQVINIADKINGYLLLDYVELKNKLPAESLFEYKTIEFLPKPILAQTEFREEIEKKKQEEERHKQIAEYNQSRNTYYRDYSLNRKPYNSAGNSYYYGYCTWYAKNKRPDLPNQLGNGGAWYYNAQNIGLDTGQTPKEGAVIVTNESGWGHVGYVEKVEDDKVIISEMNFNGWGAVNTRTLDADSSIIKGFVY